jgi:RNA recognition motif-containing protein
LELKNGRDSIYIAMDNRSRATGEAFVEFATTQDAAKALEKNRAKIGHRWVMGFYFLKNKYFYKTKSKYNLNHDNDCVWGSVVELMLSKSGPSKFRRLKFEIYGFSRVQYTNLSKILAEFRAFPGIF